MEKEKIIMLIKNNKLLILMILMLIFSLSLREGDDEKVRKIIEKYNKEREAIISYNSGVIDSNKIKIKELIQENKNLDKCITKLNNESGSVIMPSCNSLDLVIQASADYVEEKVEEKISSSPSPYKWRVNSKGQSKPRDELCGNVSPCTFESVLKLHSLPAQPFIDNEKKYGVYKETVLCIARADSGLGRYLKSKNNIGNVGNNDRGDTVSYKTIEDGIEAIFSVLNGRFLGHKQSIGSLSPGGGGNSPFYATSPENWNVNVLNCLNTITNNSVNEDSIFRTK